MRRAFSLVELLCVVAILAILAALLFPVFARGKERAKLTNCASRLHHLAFALNLYRADHDDRGFQWTYNRASTVPFQYPYNAFGPMRSYLGDGKVLWCPLPSRTSNGRIDSAYHYRTWSTDSVAAGSSIVRHRPFRPVAGSVLVWCSNHTQEDLSNATAQRGSVPYAREDTSLGIAKAGAIQVVHYSSAGWFDTAAAGRTPIYRFPGEPWPPVPEE